jgi:hypothetical protein
VPGSRELQNQPPRHQGRQEKSKFESNRRNSEKQGMSPALSDIFLSARRLRGSI